MKTETKIIQGGCAIVAVAAAYYIAAQFALLLAIPPGYATAIWPSAGIGLSALLLFGYRVAPGIALGSFLANVGTSYDPADIASLLQSLLLPLYIGLGATLQGIVGTALIRRFVGFPNVLDQENDILKFLALGGPVSCMISASIGVASLILTNTLPIHSYFINLCMWWVGDTIGVLIVTPLALVWRGEPGEMWRRRRKIVALPLCLTFAAIVWVFIGARAEFIAERHGLLAWAVLAGGLAFVALLGAFLLIVSGNMIRIEELVAARTREAALHDVLTGLPNRALVFEYAGHLLATARRNERRAALLFLDLDRFKAINDLYGHEIGDRLLAEFAKRLLASVRQEDLVGRLGGDEFIIVLPNLDNGHRAEVVARHVLESMARPFQINSHELSVSPSIGISYFPKHGDNIDTLVHAADVAMYQAKHSGRANYQFYVPELNRRADELFTTEMTLKRALHDNGLTLNYQPIIDMRSGQVIGAEALLRLSNLETTNSCPQRFISVAESAGLIGRIGEWVAAEACRQHAAWISQGMPSIQISINVSPLQFRQGLFAERLARIVADSGIDPAYLQIEVTESTVMENIDEAIDTLQQIKALGMTVALDDFGTGYSSLSHLSTLPLDKLKVDQSFIRRITHDRASRAITKAIIALGRTLKLEVVGEGIESNDTLDYLRRQGCDHVQGFLFSQPLPADDFKNWYLAR